MLRFPHMFLIVAALLLASAASARRKPHCHTPPVPSPRVKVCIPVHHSQHVTITVATAALPALAFFGGFPAGTYTADADGDGYGSTTSVVKPCPSPGFVAKSGDCDDTSAGVNPGAAEVCGNAVDDNCGAGVDEGCSVCPCFDADDVGAAHDAWQGAAWDVATEVCDDYSATGQGYSYDWVRLRWYGSRTTDGVTETQSSSFYSIDYDDVTQSTYCERYLADERVDSATGQSLNYAEDYYRQPLTLPEHEQCQAVLLQYAADSGIACTVTEIP